jgi:two-component system response regulator HydG
MERAAVFARYDRIGVADLPERVSEARSVTPPPVAQEPIVPLEEMERRHILRVVEAVRGSRRLAAQKLGIDRKTLYRKLLGYRTGV